MNLLTRKTGLGVMGFADMLVRLGVAYDSEEGVEIGQAVMRFIADEARAESERLAVERGPFLAWEGSRQHAAGMKPQRNACQLTVAPTGTISMIAGCSSGIEPIFALAFRKHNIMEGQTLFYVDSAFEAVARHEGFYSDEIAEWLSTGNSLQDSPEAPEWVKGRLRHRAGHRAGVARPHAGRLPGVHGRRHLQDHQLPQLGHRG